MLPEDARAYGFDIIGEALSASTELVEAPSSAADVAIDMVLSREHEPPRIKQRLTFTDGFKTRSNARLVFRFLDEGVVHYLSDLNSTNVRNFTAPESGTYRIHFRARAYRSTQPIKVEVGAGDVHKGNRGRHTVGYFDVQPELTEIVFEDWFCGGDGFLVRPFGIGNVRIGQNRQYAGPGLLFADYDVEGPLDEDLLAGRRELWAGLACGPAQRPMRARSSAASCRAIPSAGDRRGDRSLRRPHAAADRGRRELRRRRCGPACGLCCAPDFLFLIEPQVEDGGPISDYALASRLSYFLWSTLPTRNCSIWPPGANFAIRKCGGPRSSGCSAVPRPPRSPTTSPDSG